MTVFTELKKKEVAAWLLNAGDLCSLRKYATEEGEE